MVLETHMELVINIVRCMKDFENVWCCFMSFSL